MTFTYPDKTLFLIVGAQKSVPAMISCIGQEAYGHPHAITQDGNEWYILDNSPFYWLIDWLEPVDEQASKQTVIEEDEYDRLFV